MWAARGGLLLTAILVGATVAPFTASATSAAGVEGSELWRTSSGGTDFVYRQITIAPGGSTGWHWHDGRLYGVINEGTLTHNAADCSVDGVYPAGAGIFEPSGADHVHIGRNLASTPLVMHVLYVLPAGSPLSEDATDPACGFS
jgi:quercetin dioxygenase-like cupin family protein